MYWLKHIKKDALRNIPWSKYIRILILLENNIRYMNNNCYELQLSLWTIILYAEKWNN